MKPDFDGVARVYAPAEYLTLGPMLQRTRVHFLDRLGGCRRALVLGDGDGRFTAALLAANDSIEVNAVDSSAVMLALLRRRCARHAARLTTHRADATTFHSTQTYDLVCTHFFLDCLRQSQVNDLAAKVAARLAPGALWVVSDFRVPEAGSRVWRTLARLYIRGLYFAFRVLTGLRVSKLPEPGAALEAAALRRVAAHSSLGGLLYTELWSNAAATETSVGPSYNEAVSDLRQHEPHVDDPQPDPEPAVPSLPAPDPGVFHHTPGAQSGDLAESDPQ